MATTKRALKAKPPKRVDRRKTTSTRITPELRAQLEEAVVQSGQSLAQEIEIRIGWSFEEDEAFGGRQFRALFRLFGNAAVLIEGRTGKSCFEDWYTWVAVQAAWTQLGGTYYSAPKPKGWLKTLLEASKALSVLYSERPPEDADLDVREAYLDKSDKALQAFGAFHRLLEDDRVQEEFGREIAASLLPEKAKKGE